MAFILIFCFEVKARSFFYFITVLDLLLYWFLSVLAILSLKQSINFIFPVIIIGSFLLIVSAAFGKSFHRTQNRFTISVYYAYLRSFMNYLLILGSATIVIVTIWCEWKKGFDFTLGLILLAFEVLLDFYWTLELKEAIELLHHNQRLKFLAKHSHPVHPKHNEPLV